MKKMKISAFIAFIIGMIAIVIHGLNFLKINIFYKFLNLISF
jgi:hypothetical protein